VDVNAIVEETVNATKKNTAVAAVVVVVVAAAVAAAVVVIAQAKDVNADQTANAQKLTTVDVNAIVEETVNATKKNTAVALD